MKKQLTEPSLGTEASAMTPMSSENTPCKGENATYQRCQNLTSNFVGKTANNTAVGPDGDKKALSLSSSFQSNKITTTARMDDKVRTGDGLSAVAIIVISSALVIFIALFIVLDRINRKYKSPFPCKYIGAPKIHVGD